MDSADKIQTAASSFRMTGTAGAMLSPAPLVKDETDVNATSKAPNLKKLQEKKKTIKVEHEICWFQRRLARTPSPAARPAPGQEMGTGEAPGTRCLPPAASASSIQLLQSASSSGMGTEASGFGSVPS